MPCVEFRKDTELMTSSRSHIAKVARLALAALLAGACTEATDPIAIASIQLEPGLDSIEVGATYSGWLVTLRDANGATLSGRPLDWESSNKSVATVDPSSGVVTGVSTGESVIKVRANGLVAQSSIRILVPLVAIVVIPDSFDLALTTTRQIQPALVGPNGVALTNRLITWSSSNPLVAVVSTNGVVTAVSQGTATIMVRAGSKQANVRVRVTAEPVNSVRISPPGSNHILRVTHTKQLSAECLSASQLVLPGRSISWNSTNPIVASISNSGLVTAHTVGQTTIQATCDNTVTGQTTVTVTPVPVSSVTITPNGLSLGVNASGQLLAVAKDSAGNTLSLLGRSVVWTTNNEPVARVSNSGVVTAVSIGTAQITVMVDLIASAPVTIDAHALFSANRAFDAARRPRHSGLR